MHKELKVLLAAAAVLEKVDQVIAKQGVTGSVERGTLTAGDAMQTFGTQLPGPLLAWGLNAEPVFDDGPDEDIDDPETWTEPVATEIVITVALTFDQHSIFVVAYDALDRQWKQAYAHISTAEEGGDAVPIPNAASQRFATSVGVTKWQASDDDSIDIAAERAFDLIAAMARCAQEAFAEVQERDPDLREEAEQDVRTRVVRTLH